MNDKRQLKVLNFAAKSTPQPYESKEKDDNKYVSYGKDNLYPDFLLYLFNNGGTHASIIENKTNYIVGIGLQFADGKVLDFMVNAQDNVQELVEKCVKDYLIFGYFFVSVHYNAFGSPMEYHHVPAQTVRMNKSKTKFWYNKEWCHSKKDVIQFERWSKKYDGVTTRMFMYDGYSPSPNNVYSIPDYNAAIKSLRIDIDIETFIENNIRNHFSPSTIIDFFSGANVSDEAKEAVVDELEGGYTGVDGKKIIVSFNDPDKGKKTEVTNISPTDWADVFNECANNAQDRILRAHQVTSPMLFGVKTEGQLGGATELETAYQIFKRTYANRRRKALESAFNLLFSNFEEVTGKVAFGDEPLFPPQVPETLKEKIMTINEIRKEAGLPPIEGGDRFIDQPQAMMLQPVKPTAAPAQMESDKKKVEEDLLSQFNNMADTYGFSFDEFDLIEDSQDNFTITQRLQFDVDSDIAAYVVENDIRDLTLAELKELILKDLNVKISAKDLKGVLNRLAKSGVIEVDNTDGKVKVTPSNVTPAPDSDKVQVMYQYIKRKGIEGPVLLETSRPFCIKLINNNRLYTRSEVQQMSGLFGYSVFDYTGGWYYNPKTNQTTPYCRHEWKTVRVKRKEQQ